MTGVQTCALPICLLSFNLFCFHTLFSRTLFKALGTTLCLLRPIFFISRKLLRFRIRRFFGNIFNRKARLKARIKGIQSALASNPNQFLINLERQLTTEYSQFLNLEDEYWSTKSRYNWIIQGDRNIALFHTFTMVKRGKNKIVCIKDNLGNWVEDPGAIANVIKDSFFKLFSIERVKSDRFC